MKQFPYIEDYLEYLAGFDYGSGSKIFAVPQTNSRISLARYDVNIVDSMSSHTVWGGGLTDRQAELCVKLILKYRRQFANQGIDVTPAENPQYRIPPRSIDRTRRVWLEDNLVCVRFPYDRQLIDQVQEYKKTSQGSMVWKADEKLWTFGLTESNINWLVVWGEIHQFNIAQEVRELYNKIIAVEQIEFKIELTNSPNGLVITNAPNSMLEYIDQHLGGIHEDNLLKLIDYAGVLGYEVNDNIPRPALLDLFGTKRNLHIPPGIEGSLNVVFEYARLTDRYPVCIYDPSLRGVDLSQFSEDEIVRFDASGKTKSCDYNYHSVKVIYANKIPAHWDYDIPLLVSTVEMLYGGKRMEWLNRAEKIVYYCEHLLRENTQ